MADYEHLTHTFQPVFNQDSKILILGTFPSAASRAQHFYYGHPQNRFWKVLAALTGENIPEGIPEKKRLLLDHKIAIWDVIQSCDIIGSSDSSIRNVVPSDIHKILTQAKISAIFGNGAKACKLFESYALPALKEKADSGKEPAWTPKDPIHKLPSTSPANAAWSLERLMKAWHEEICPFL